MKYNDILDQILQHPELIPDPNLWDRLCNIKTGERMTKARLKLLAYCETQLRNAGYLEDTQHGNL